MSLEICPECGNKSLIHTPRARMMLNSLGCDLHTADEHSMDCLDKGCEYTSGIIRVNTKMGDWMELPWWKRIYKKIEI